jgi:hypothetical protein
VLQALKVNKDQLVPRATQEILVVLLVLLVYRVLLGQLVYRAILAAQLVPPVQLVLVEHVVNKVSLGYKGSLVLLVLLVHKDKLVILAVQLAH